MPDSHRPNDKLAEVDAVLSERGIESMRLAQEDLEGRVSQASHRSGAAPNGLATDSSTTLPP